MGGECKVNIHVLHSCLAYQGNMSVPWVNYHGPIGLGTIKYGQRRLREVDAVSRDGSMSAATVLVRCKHLEKDQESGLLSRFTPGRFVGRVLVREGRIREGQRLARLKAGIHFASSVLVKTFAGLIVIKLLAWKLGPDGFGLLGQLMTIVAITGMFAGGGITNGLIKALAKSPINTTDGEAWGATAFTLTTIVSILVASLLICFSTSLSSRIMQGGYAFLFFGLAVTQAIVGYGALVLAEASSRGASGLYANINILGTIIGTAVLAFAVYSFGFAGAAYSVVIMPALTAGVALVFVMVKRRELIKFVKLLIDVDKIYHLLSFSMLTLAGAISIPLAQIIVRDIMGEQLGWEQVGLWQGVVKLSDVYMQFVGVVLINYMLPRYAAATDMKSIFAEFRVTLAALLLTLLLGFFVLYMFRGFIVRMVFSEAFLPMTDYFIPQMVGDIFRTIAASISFIFMARGAIRISIIFELSQGILLVTIFSLIFGISGRMAPVYAHLITYCLLSIIMGGGLWFWTKRSQS